MMTSCIMGVTCPRWSSPMQSLLPLFVLFQVVQLQSEWQEKPRNQLVPVGGTARFVCKAPNLNTQIVWTKSTEVLFVNGQRFGTTIPARYTLVDDFTLQIAQVQKSDDGMYGCNVQDFGSASANLTVLFAPGAPSITFSPPDSSFVEDQQVRFTCSSSGGNPAPTISWMKNGLELLNVLQTTTVNGTTSNDLTVIMNHSDHQANYTCSVYNIVNQNNSFIASKVLNVRYSPILTFQPFSPYTVREGTTANITCQVDANPSISTVTWLKDGATIGNSNVMRMFNPIRWEDAGNYTCVASNSVNSANPSRNTITVDVVYPPSVSVKSTTSVQESKPLRETCNVVANPRPYLVNWEKVLPSSGRVKVSNSDVLEFTQIRREDMGNYSCKASSYLQVSGSSTPEPVFGESFMYVYVEYAPGPASISPVANIDVGQTLSIMCTATPEGYPPAEFRWFRNGVEQSQRSSTFTIASASLSDSALYICTPYNNAGQGVSANISVSINEPPTLIQSLQEEMSRTISSTQPLTLTCKGQGRPEPLIEWFKDNMTENLQTQPLYFSIQSTKQMKNLYSTEVTSTLSFKGPGRNMAPSGERIMLRIEDLGNYTCRVRSLVHVSSPSSKMQLYVQFPPEIAQPVRKIAVTVADRAQLPCTVQSYPPPLFQWYRDGQPVDFSSPKYSEQQMTLTTVVAGFQSILTIESVGANDYGIYNCHISNILANKSAVINVTTKSTPEAPSSVQTLSPTWESIYLKWTPGFDGGYPQQFQVQYRAPDISNQMFIVPSQPLSAFEFNVTGLRPSTRYEFVVFGQNKLGMGHNSMTISSQTKELEIPTLGDAVPTYHTSSRQLVITAQPSNQYCLKIDAKLPDGQWRTLKQCTRVLGGGSLEISEEGVTAVNVSVCLVDRPEVCGSPTAAIVSSPDGSPTLTVRDVIIIACVCALIIIILLIILVCFICRRRRAQAKEYENAGIPPPSTSNGGVPGKKIQQGQGQGYDNAGMVLNDPPPYGSVNVPMSSLRAPESSSHANSTNLHSSGGRYPTFASSSEHPPTYWDSNPQDYDSRNNLSFDSQIDRQMYELELNRRNDFALYGRADGYRGQQETINMQTRPMSPSKDKYIDLEDRKDPSLQSQESGYSTGDPNKPKKVIYEVVV